MIHGWGGKLGALAGTETGNRLLDELEKIDIEQVLGTFYYSLLKTGHSGRA